ncbi:hypothetical protein T4D_1055 [Trichinella pseudospiralis]|uniref:Uncharacterized protein n=1 Tax=Trichinella pseudospiralis TaxID=6337 RepID=A0A0V1FIE5_TRIPS|nr:hypothetical protein T4D_1055 [Trichinella pseudospiralis]
MSFKPVDIAEQSAALCAFQPTASIYIYCTAFQFDRPLLSCSVVATSKNVSNRESFSSKSNLSTIIFREAVDGLQAFGVSII